MNAELKKLTDLYKDRIQELKQGSPERMALYKEMQEHTRKFTELQDAEIKKAFSDKKSIFAIFEINNLRLGGHVIMIVSSNGVAPVYTMEHSAGIIEIDAADIIYYNIT